MKNVLCGIRGKKRWKRSEEDEELFNEQSKLLGSQNAPQTVEGKLVFPDAHMNQIPIVVNTHKGIVNQSFNI